MTRRITGQLICPLVASICTDMYVIILPVVLYRRETWSLLLCEKYRPRKFRNRVLRKISGHKRKEERDRNSFIVSGFALS
jgi:hypothetical protein